MEIVVLILSFLICLGPWTDSFTCLCWACKSAQVTRTVNELFLIFYLGFARNKPHRNISLSCPRAGVVHGRPHGQFVNMISRWFLSQTNSWLILGFTLSLYAWPPICHCRHPFSTTNVLSLVMVGILGQSARYPLRLAVFLKSFWLDKLFQLQFSSGKNRSSRLESPEAWRKNVFCMIPGLCIVGTTRP